MGRVGVAMEEIEYSRAANPQKGLSFMVFFILKLLLKRTIVSYSTHSHLSETGRVYFGNRVHHG